MKWIEAFKRVVLLTGCTVMIFAITAADGAQIEEWTVYNTANSGLPYNGATMLAFDQKGAIWIGTGKWFALAGGGLAKFDGESWVVYNTANSPLPNNDHFGLAVDPQGNVWAGTEGGLAKFDGVNWTVYNTSNSGLRDNRVGPPVFDDHGHFWAGTWGGGLVEFDGVNWTVYNTANSGLPNNTPFATAFDKQGNLWIGTVGGGLAKFDGTNWTVFNTANSPLPNNTVFYIDFDSQENLWIATDGGGLAKFDGINWTVYNTSNSGLPSNRIWPIAVDSQDNVWIGTADRGVAMYNGSTWKTFDTSNSGLADNAINFIAVDVDGSIWIAAQSGGLTHFNTRPIVDFNGDGEIDMKDLLRLIKSWALSDPAIDIGPEPFGDDKIDEADLEVLMKYWKQHVEDPTLIAHWALDETDGDIAYDSAGVNDASVVGSPVWQPVGGQVNGAVDLDGVDDCIVAEAPLNPADGPFSVFAWVNGGAPGQAVISEASGPDWLSLDSQSGHIMTELTSMGRYASSLISQTAVNDGAWHRIGLVWDGSHRILYVDGVEAAQDTQENLESPVRSFYIGTGKAMAPGTYFAGLIDDVRIYNRAVKP